MGLCCSDSNDGQVMPGPDAEPAAVAAAPPMDPKVAKKAAEFAALGEEYKTPDSDGFDFTAATSQAIAYERMIETIREDSLFLDHLAEHFIGQRGKKVSAMLNFGLGTHVGCPDIHRRFTAARTKLVNDHMTDWIKAMVEKGEKVQVACLGAGMDTRAFWVASLSDVERYVEVDVAHVNNFKEQKLAEIGDKSLCERQVISMDFGKESTKDLPSHGFDPSLPTCWILEGLVMYLPVDAVKALLDEITDLSANGSYMILNYMNGPGSPADIGHMSERLHS